MEYDLSSTRLPYRGWEIRSHLTSVSIDGTVAAGAVLSVGDDCKCHIMSCRQFANGCDAIRAIEQRAARWIDVRERSSEASPVEHAPFFDELLRSVSFWVLIDARLVNASIRRETLHDCYRPTADNDDPLDTYKLHASEIDAAVHRRVAEGSVEPVVLRQFDLHEADGKGVDQPDSARWVHREALASAGAVQCLPAG